MKWLFLSIVGRWRLGHWRKVCLFLIFASTVTRQTFSTCCQHLRVGARNPPLHILHVTLSGHLTSTCLSLLQLVTWAIPFRIWERLSSLNSLPPQLPKWKLSSQSEGSCVCLPWWRTGLSCLSISSTRWCVSHHLHSTYEFLKTVSKCDICVKFNCAAVCPYRVLGFSPWGWHYLGMSSPS